MKIFLSLKQNKIAFSLSVIVAVFFVVSVVSAVTTITTNIDTAGTLNVSSLSTLTNASSTLFSVGTSGGSSGTTLAQILKGTCNLSTTVARTALSTSTLPFQCAVTNAASGDQVFVSLANDGGSVTGPANIGGIRASYAIASSAAGYIEVGLSNWSGAATSSYTIATTSVQYWIVR